ncbi:MAG: hypothetical protein KA885_12900 [Spirochaetes bacterium]|nr:hypothetical protein [Spirochaetota bacterium]
MADVEKKSKEIKEMLEEFYKKTESRIKDLTNVVKDNILPDAEEKLKKNVITSVLVSFGIGFILGVILMVFGISRGKKK